jgi:hypothetical protein
MMKFNLISCAKVELTELIVYIGRLHHVTRYKNLIDANATRSRILTQLVKVIRNFFLLSSTGQKKSICWPAHAIVLKVVQRGV